MAKPKIIQITASGTSASDSDGFTTTYDSVFALLDDGRVLFATPRHQFPTEWTVLDLPDPQTNMLNASTGELVGE